MIRWVLVGILMASGASAFGQTADVIREISELLEHRTARPSPFGGVIQRGGQPPIPPPPLNDPDDPKPRLTQKPLRVTGPTPGGPQRFDRNGDPLPAGAIARFGSIRLRHGTQPSALIFTPDGKQLVSASDSLDGLRLWDVATGKETARWAEPVTCAAFARDGRIILIDDKRCKVWQPTTNMTQELPEGTIPAPATAIAVHPDSRSFAVGVLQKIVLLDMQTGKQRQEFKTPGGAMATRIAYSPDGRWLAATGLKTGVWLWDLRTAKRVRTYAANSDEVCEFAFSPDSNRIVISANQLSVYTTDSEEEIEGFTTPEEPLAHPTFSADGKSILGQKQNDGSVLRLDAATGEVKDTWNSPNGKNKKQPFALAPGGMHAASTDDQGGINLWESKTGKGPKVDRLTMLYDPWLSDDGKSAGCLDYISRIHEFDPLTGASKKIINLPIDEDASVWWDMRARRAAAVVEGEQAEVHIIDIDTGKVTCKFPTKDGAAVSFCADRNRVVVFAAGTVTVVNVNTGRTLHTVSLGSVTAATAMLSPDGRLLATSTNITEVWEVRTEKKRFTIDLPGSRDVVFSPDGRLLATWDNRSVVLIFDVRTGTTLRRFQLPSGDNTLSCVMFSPDSKRLVTGSEDGVIALWDVATADPLLVLEQHEGDVTAFNFSADGTRLLSTSRDGTALLWDLTARPQPKADLLVSSLDDAFKLLASLEAPQAQRGMEYLYRRPDEAVKFIAERVPVPTATPADRIAKLIVDLDSDDFQTRVRATKELEGVGCEALTAVRTAAEKSASAEVRRLAGEVVSKLEGVANRPDDLRVLRVVEVAEHIGTPASRELLKKWAAGPAGHRLTVEATAVVTRLTLMPRPR